MVQTDISIAPCKSTILLSLSPDFSLSPPLVRLLASRRAITNNLELELCPT